MREKTTRRWLSLLLTVVMVLSLVPATALAAYFGAPVGDLSPIDSLEPIEKLEPVEGEEPIDVLPVEEEPVTDSDLAGEEALETAALTIGSKPADGTTQSQPFASGTGGSDNFRIPALVTLSDGTLVAAADARWNQTGDGWGLDTIVSRSSNYGATWSYTFANYLGDNGNIYHSNSTAFIDPALAVARDDTIYMLVDLYPHGTYIGNVEAGTGYDTNDRLALRASSDSAYNYYLYDGQIFDYKGNVVENYKVDEYFNITGNDGVNTNLFFSDSPFQVLSTSYLYLTKSTDGGKNWSAPMMLNSQVKNESDMFYGVGPGGGIVTSTGRIIFPCYTYTTQDGNTSVIYSDDGGETWTRSADMTAQTSEASISEVTVNGQNYLYMFTRHGGYFVSSDNGVTWSNQQSVGISYTTSCELSTLTYSKTIDGYPAILLSAPTSGRTTGKIFVGLVQDDLRINWKYTYAVNGSGAYQYSDLAELKDGSIGLLYENGSASITYTKIAITDIAPGAEIGGAEEEPAVLVDNATGVSVNFGANDVTEMTVTSATVDDLAGRKYVAYDIIPEGYTESAEVTIPLTDELKNCANLTGFVVENGTVKEIEGKRVGDSYTFTTPHFSIMGVAEVLANEDVTERDVTVYVGQSTTITDTTGNYESSYTGDGLNTSIATVTVTGQDGTGSGAPTLGSKIAMDADGTYTGVISNGSGHYLVIDSNGSISDTTNIAAATDFTVTRTTTGKYYTTTTYTIQGNGYYLYVKSTGSWSKTYSLETTTDKYSGWTYYSDYGFYDNNRCLTYDNGWTVTSSSGNGFLYEKNTDAGTPASTTITITGVAAGTTSVVVGSTQYNITVKEKPDGVDLASTPFTSGTGQYSGQKVTKLTTSVNKSYDLNLNISGSSIVWSSADTSIATVDQNGTITGVGPGETTVTCTVDGVPYTIPVVVVSDSYGGRYDYTCDIRISEITNTTVRYSLNLSTNFLDAQEGEAIYLGYNYPFCINFFGVEDNGYALTFMSSTNSAGNYYSLYQVDALSELAAYTGGAIKNQRESDGFNSSDVDTMLWYAIDNGYHGTMGWTRTTTYTGTSIYSDLTFKSEKLPTVEKSIKTVNGEAYTEGMTAKAGDKIVYEVTVTQYATDTYEERNGVTAITYTNPSLTDRLADAIFTENQSSTVTPKLKNGNQSSNTVTNYEVTYTIKDEDLDKEIINTVALSYDYKSAYSEGTFSGTASAEAKISAPTFTPKDIVIDFGLPVTIDYGSDHGRYNLKDGFANNGVVDVENNVVTYTPNADFLLYGANPAVDTVTLTNTEGLNYTFKVIPASNVLYEDNFLTQEDGNRKTWTAGTPDTSATQENGVVDTDPNVYGYDDAYKSSINDSMNSAWTVTGLNATDNLSTNALTTSFYGNGFDLIAECGENTAQVYVVIKDKDNKAVKGAIVDTRYKDGTLYQVPIAHLTLDEEDTYTATIRAYYIKGTAASGTSANLFSTRSMYSQTDTSSLDAVMADVMADGLDLEDVELMYFDSASPLASLGGVSAVSTFALDTNAADTSATVERQAGTRAVIDGFRVYRSSSNTAYKTDEQNVTYVNVLDATLNTDSFTAYTENGTGIWTQDTYEAAGGPQNEVYLDSTSAIAFKVVGAASVQISARVAKGSASLVVNGTTVDLKSNTEMYYTVTPQDGIVTIKSSGDGLLALGNLKLPEGVNTAELTEEDQPMVFSLLRMAAAPVEPDEPEEPEVSVFQPAKLDLNVTSANFFTRKIVTLSITASSDVAYLTVNGKRVEPTNALLVKWGLAKNYLYVVTDTVSRNATAEFAVVAYDANGVASEVYVKQG